MTWQIPEDQELAINTEKNMETRMHAPPSEILLQQRHIYVPSQTLDNPCLTLASSFETIAETKIEHLEY